VTSAGRDEGTTGRERVARVTLVLTSLALSAGLLVSRIPLLTTRRFDPDELEHSHVAFCILRGQVPFRDFFEHHTPIFHYLLAAIFSFFDIAGSPDAAMRALFAARYVTWGMSVAIVAMTFLLARRLRDATTAWVALPIASGSIVLALRAIEIRPDGLSTLFWLFAILALYEAFAAATTQAGRTRVWFVLSGAGIALAVLTSQKLLLAGPALAVLMLWYVGSSRFGGGFSSRVPNALVQAGAVAVIWGLAAAWFWHDGAAGDFLRFTLFDNL
jgi:4-amino-4-deoxy-L-arabinose transferase-like glycosyltransferase